jgi:integrase/recombinase XerD
MKLLLAIDQFVAAKQSLGMQFRSARLRLNAFARSVGNIDITQVTSAHVLTYLNGTGPLTTYWHLKHTILKGFFSFAVGRGYLSASPLPILVPKRPPRFVPYIYSDDELRRLLDTVELLKRRRCHPFWVLSIRTLLLLLYGAALRVSEALSLTLADVDLPDSVLTIRDSKFYKTRLVPIGPQLTASLTAYAKERRRLPLPVQADSAFFSKKTGKPLSIHYVDHLFRKICQRAGISRTDGGRYQPRLHDLRHTSAVNHLLNWYRQGKDVQRLLSHLATYLGHVDIAHTQVYLTMTPELLQQANQRFERYALSSEVNHVQP